MTSWGVRTLFLVAARRIARTAFAQGWIDPSAVRAIAAEIDAWAERPDAFAATTWCQALGWA